MKKQIFNSKPALIIVFAIACNFTIYGQTNNITMPGDSLSLAKIINIVVENHPSVSEMKEAIASAEAGIGIAKSGYYPTVDVTSSYSHIGPANKMEMPGLGSIQFAPVDIYSGSLNINETVYDFGKTAKNVKLSIEMKKLSTLSAEQIKQKLATTVTTLYYGVVYSQEAIKINKAQLKTLNEHLDFIVKKKESGSATQYEVLSTKVKISVVEKQGIELKTSLDNLLTEINSLMGQPADTRFYVKQNLEINLPDHPSDSLISYAFEHRDETIIMREKTSIASLKYNVAKSQNNPVISLTASGGGKNGYEPNLNAVKANYTIGASFKFKIFDGIKTKYTLQQEKTAINTSSLEIDIAKRNISTEVTENINILKSSLKKVENDQLQLSQAQEAYALAEISFKAGSIINLDLLDATNAVSESKLALLKSQVEYIQNVYKLKASIGDRLY